MSVLNQWNEVEASFAQHYNLSLPDLFTMSWRRFRVLFTGVFSWNDTNEEAYEPGQGTLAASVDWDAALQSQPAAPDLLSSFQGTKIHVGK